jgi:acyl-CoA synthetase (NDP forming)
MRPESVAVIGASDDPSRIGGRPVRYLLQAGFAGSIRPVNPNRSRVQGLQAFPSITAMPAGTDLAVVALPAAPAVAAVRDCAAAGIGSVILFGADFAESGPEGAALQAEVTAIAAGAGMALLGPNCLGAFNPQARLFATFSSLFDEGFPEAGSVGIVSQSGGFGSHLAKVCLNRGVRLGPWMTTGNEAGLDVGQCICWMAAQEEVAVILAYVEGVRDRGAMVAGLEAARAAGKPVLIMKAGASEVGAAAAQTHTAALAGSDGIFDGMLAGCGAVRLPTAEAVADAAYLLQRTGPLRGNRLGAVTISGAAGVQIADAAAAQELLMPALPEASQAALKALIPFAGTRNPVDITAQAFNRLEVVRSNLEIVLEAGCCDALVAFFTMTAGSPDMAPGLAAAMANLPERYGIPICLCILAGPELVRGYEKAGFLVFEDLHRAVAAIGVATRVGRVGEPVPAQQLPNDDAVEWLRRHDGTETSAKAVLRALGITVPAGHVARTVEEAGEAAARIGGAVALKLHSRSVDHKSELGGVVIGLRGAGAVQDAAAAMQGRVAPALFNGFLVEAMAPAGVELIVGLQHDPGLGPVLMVGLGGFHAELYADVAFRLAPAAPGEVLAALRGLRGRKVFEGFRGAAAADLEAVAEAVSCLSHFFADQAQGIASLEINPLRALPPGEGVIACDAVLKLALPLGAGPTTEPG